MYSVRLWASIHITRVHENHRTHQTFPMTRPRCLLRDFTNLNRIYKAHRTNVWWIMKVFQVHCIMWRYLTTRSCEVLKPQYWVLKCSCSSENCQALLSMVAALLRCLPKSKIIRQLRTSIYNNLSLEIPIWHFDQRNHSPSSGGCSVINQHFPLPTYLHHGCCSILNQHSHQALRHSAVLQFCCLVPSFLLCLVS